MTDPDEHVFAGIFPFGLRRFRATCSCGYAAKPVEGSEFEVAEAARRVFFDEHDPRDLRPDEPAHAVLLGKAGSTRPTPGRTWTPPEKDPHQEPPGR